jgi:hypothetical protein
MKLIPIIVDVTLSEVTLNKGIDINYLHTILGHCGKVTARMTGKSHVNDILDESKSCNAWSIGKVRNLGITC